MHKINSKNYSGFQNFIGVDTATKCIWTRKLLHLLSKLSWHCNDRGGVEFNRPWLDLIYLLLFDDFTFY